MKRDSVPHFLLVLGVLAVAGLVIWPGCATPPLPATRTSLSNLRVTDFKFPRGSQPTRTELETQLGKPDEFFEDVNVACYRLNKVSRRRLWLFLGVIPIAAPQDPDLIELGFVQFDAQRRVSRVGVRTEGLVISLGGLGGTVPDEMLRGTGEKRFHRAAERWLAEPEPASKGIKR